MHTKIVCCGVFLAVTALYEIVSGCDMHSPLPKAAIPITEWNNLNGTWYETVTSSDPISENHACVSFTDLTLTSTGLGEATTVHYDNGLNESFHLHILHTKDGYFRQGSVSSKELPALGDDEYGRINVAAVSEGKEMKWKEYTLLGDQDHYMSYVHCSPEGWVFWAFTKEQTVTPERLLYIHNDLLKHGVSAPLRLGRCKNV